MCSLLSRAFLRHYSVIPTVCAIKKRLLNTNHVTVPTVAKFICMDTFTEKGSEIKPERDKSQSLTLGTHIRLKGRGNYGLRENSSAQREIACPPCPRPPPPRHVRHPSVTVSTLGRAPGAAPSVIQQNQSQTRQRDLFW